LPVTAMPAKIFPASSDFCAVHEAAAAQRFIESLSHIDKARAACGR
jgi:hypothetical protein